MHRGPLTGPVGSGVRIPGLSGPGNSVASRVGWPDGGIGGGRAVSEAQQLPVGATTREGFAVLWVAIRRERGIFALSTLGSVLFGALTVADAWVLGWATDR